MESLCVDIADRSVGSEGNRRATEYFEHEVASRGWRVDLQEFDAIDWEHGAASLHIGDESFEVHVTPYSLGCSVIGKLLCVSTIEELERSNIREKIVVLHGSIAIEQLMPKSFVFYNPEEHQRIIRLLETGDPEAIVCVTGRNAALAGGVYPFPLIEDGDFDIPSVYMTDEEGKRLVTRSGAIAALNSNSTRIPGKGYNVIAKGGAVTSSNRIAITAHIDAKKGTPGAIDNGSGVAVLLVLAEILRDYDAIPAIELVALNGEDYFSVPGQMRYIAEYEGCFDEVLANINIDGAGYLDGDSAFSFYELPEELEKRVRGTLSGLSGIAEGVQWPQGDHSIFVQYGRPAIAFSSKWFTENIDNQEITHTEKDNLSIVDYAKIVEVADAIARLVHQFA